jgi:MazG family protein
MISVNLSIDKKVRLNALWRFAKQPKAHVLGAMEAIQDLRTTMARLRGPGGCPWDQEQDHHTLTETLIEETAELIEAIDHEDIPHMREELGDVLLQVVFHAQLASEAGHFDFDDVAREINDKLVRRHPHVFGDLDVTDSAEVLVNWERIKAEEKSGKPPPSTLLKALPPRLPALLFARDTYKQIRKRGFSGVLPEELVPAAVASNGASAEELGAALFALVASAHEAGTDPEAALRHYTQGLIDKVENGSGSS